MRKKMRISFVIMSTLTFIMIAGALACYNPPDPEPDCSCSDPQGPPGEWNEWDNICYTDCTGDIECSGGCVWIWTDGDHWVPYDCMCCADEEEVGPACFKCDCSGNNNGQGCLSQFCEECDGNGYCVSKCEPGQFCCNGQCCNQPCCGNIQVAICCGDGLLCCTQEGYNPQCYDPLQQCCEDGQLKDCCKTESTKICEGHNVECGCDPPGPSMGCGDKKKEWTIGQTRYCQSECAGWPCNTTLTNVPCYAWRICKQSAVKHWYQECGGGDIPDPYYQNCAPVIFPIYCQECTPTGNAFVEPGQTCQCN